MKLLIVELGYGTSNYELKFTIMKLQTHRWTECSTKLQCNTVRTVHRKRFVEIEKNF